jgi:hypothetical protein
MDDKLFEFIADLTTSALHREHPIFEVFRQQWNLARKHLREGKLELTGVGFYYYYLLPETVTKLSIEQWTLGDIGGWVNGDYVYCRLLIQGGIISIIDGCVLDEWPQVIREYRVEPPALSTEEIEKQIHSLIRKNPALAFELEQLQKGQKPT